MLLQKVDSACGKMAMGFKTRREPSWLKSSIMCFINTTLSQFYPHEIYGNTHTCIFCMWDSVMSCSAEPCDKMHAFSHVGHVCTRVCAHVCCSCVHIYTHTQRTNYKLLSVTKT